MLFRSMAIRAAILSNHYASDWEWTRATLEGAVSRLDLWRRALAMQAGADGLSVLQQIRLSLSQDLNSPAALAAVDRWADATLAGDESDSTAQGLVARALDSLLGLAL